MDTLPSENTSKILLSDPCLCLNMEVEDDVVGDLGEPANYKAAMLDPDKVIWKGAMDEEMNSANHEVGVQTKTSLLLGIWCVVISHHTLAT
ncbi:hypothetical protein Tco_0403148, partial [Tanacetum coccineum]